MISQSRTLFPSSTPRTAPGQTRSCAEVGVFRPLQRSAAADCWFHRSLGSPSLSRTPFRRDGV